MPTSLWHLRFIDWVMTGPMAYLEEDHSSSQLHWGRLLGSERADDFSKEERESVGCAIGAFQAMWTITLA